VRRKYNKLRPTMQGGHLGSKCLKMESEDKQVSKRRFSR
jgi:hypothetical protein